VDREKIFYVAISIAISLGVWWLTSGTIFHQAILPSPPEVAERFWEMIITAELLTHLWISLKRIFIGCVFGCSLGFIIGTSMGGIRLMKDILEPPFQFFRNIPPVALVPLAITMLGIGETSKISVIVYITILSMTLNCAAGMESTPQIRIRAALCLGARRRDVFFRVVLPSAWPYVLTGLRVAVGYSFMAVVAAEMIAADKGIGFLIMQSILIIHPREMVIGIILLGGLGLMGDRIFLLLIHRLMRRYMITMKEA
jgi:ABC-type nitrate/sulfonate/bicarbonate transport system permease component